MNTKKNKRGRRRGAKNFHKQLRFLGVNSAGLRSKMSTFKKVVAELKPSVFLIEETKFKDEGKFKMENYIIFELVRKSRDGGGGLALGCEKDLHPVWVKEGDDETEALSVEISLQKMKIRCCVAYGCQENDRIERKSKFWNYLDDEVTQASNSGAGFILHFDGNLWAGCDIIPGDPRKQNRNGKLFEEFLARNPHLTVVNSLQLCKGLITRSRLKDGSQEESILDFFIVCSRVLPYVTSMVIDESKKYVLTNYEKVRKGGTAHDTDHATEIMDINLSVLTEKPERKEMLNLKDKDAQELFKHETSKTREFTNCFRNDLPLYNQIENWRSILKSFLKKSFKKIRIKKKTVKPLKPEISNLINQRNILVNDKENQEKIESLNKAISKLEAKENRDLIMENFKHYSDNPEQINLSQMWKTLKKLWPKCGNSMPSAKKNHRGKVISGPRGLKKLLAKEYKERLRTRPVRPDYQEIDEQKEKVFQLKMKLAATRKSPDWTLSDLEKALGDLKRNKSRDPEGLINEIFKLDVIGDDLKNSLLIMFNQVKKKKMIPSFMNYSNITTVPKRGSKLELMNERGIFRVAVLRYILMRLIYNTKYPEIDQNISDCQMGARKGKNCKNNIFIVNGIIHEVMKSKRMKPVLLQIYDYAQMFDSINLQKAINDVFDYGLNDENLVLIHEANKEVNMAVNTPSGLSDREVIKNSVLQGDTFGSILASVQVDTIGKECEEAGLGYLYKDSLQVSMLGLVDDMLGVTEADYTAQQMNALINVKTASKGLQFGVRKCKSMLVGKDPERALVSNLTVDKWKVVHEDDPITGEDKIVETYEGQVPIEMVSEQKYLGFILSNKGDNMININHMKAKSKGIIRRIFNKLNSLNLGCYYFECALVFMKCMLRSSILFACESYYDLKETEVRQLERIEEGFLRELFKTSHGCPITQLYLECGLIPARLEILKTRLLYLKYILNQNQDSMLYKFFQIQLETSSKGDWAAMCLNDLKTLNIQESLKEIQDMSESKFKNILKDKVSKEALIYLTEKQRNKGGEIFYSKLQMSEYLLPNSIFSNETKREVFAMRNKMVNIPANFSSKAEFKCQCGNKEDMEHVYSCKILNSETTDIHYEEIYKDNIYQISEVHKRFQKNLKKREKLMNENEGRRNPHVILPQDPLYSVYSNG